MTDVVYLMGAGASYGKRTKEDLSHKVEIINGDTNLTYFSQILE